MIHATSKPSRPPTNVRKKFSHITCDSKALRLAPKDLRTPISGKRLSIRLAISPFRFSEGTTKSTSTHSIIRPATFQELKLVSAGYSLNTLSACEVGCSHNSICHCPLYCAFTLLVKSLISARKAFACTLSFTKKVTLNRPQ